MVTVYTDIPLNYRIDFGKLCKNLMCNFQICVCKVQLLAKLILYLYTFLVAKIAEKRAELITINIYPI
jgi:hypothetical protein